MAITLSQHKETTDASSVTSRTMTLGSATSAGDHVLLFIVTVSTPPTITVSGLGATWTFLGNDPSGAYYLFSGVGCGAGNTLITVASSTSAVLDMAATIWAGAGSVASFALTNGSSTAINTPTLTPTSTSQVVVGGWGQGGLSDTWSSFVDNPSAWTTIVANAVGNRRIHEGYVTGTTSAASEAATNSAIRGWGSFAAVLSGGTPPVSTSGTFARTARGISLTPGTGRGAALTAARTARTFTASATASLAGAVTAARTARGFTLTVRANVPTAAGRPDAATATGWGRLDRDFSLTAEADPPIDPPPAAHPSTFYRRAHYTYTPPTYSADGWSHPTQTRTLIDDSVVGRHRMRFDGVDRTYFRGVPMRLVEDSHANPFGPEIAVFHFPQISPFEAKPSWLHDGAKVITTLVDDTGHTIAGSAQFWFVHNYTPELAEDSWGVTVEAKGFVYQGDDEINKPSPTTQGGAAVPIGQRVAAALNSIIGRRFPRVATVDTSPAITRSRGSLSQTILGFIRDLLGTAWTSDSRQWTVLDVAGVMKAQIVLPDPTAVDYTLSAGQDGVTFDLHEEQDEQPNVVYGEWIDPNGGRHQRLKFPRLHEDTSPTYPLSVGAVFNPGSGTTGFQPFSDWMRRNGFSGFDSANTYLASDSDDVEEAQDRMGVTVDGVVGAQTWGTAFNTGADVGDLRKAIYLPIAADTRVMPFLYAPDGALIGRNPAYDPTIRRKEIYVNFGEGLTYRDVRRSAKQIVTRNTTGISLVGQITVHGADFEEISKLVARGGTTLRVRYLYGTGSAGVKFHLARIHRSYADDGTVTCTLDVDTKWRDAYTVAQIIERNKEARRDPARLLRRAQTSGLSQDTKIQFDADDIGRIYPHNVQGGFWRIVEFPAASWGTWVHVTAVTSPATEFALMLFSAEVTARDLDRLVGNPLSASHPYNAQATALKAAGLIQAWGSADQPAGYSKTDAADGYKSDGDTLTGRLEYDSNVEFAPANGASLFLAEWCAASTVIHERLELQPVSL